MNSMLKRDEQLEPIFGGNLCVVPELSFSVGLVSINALVCIEPINSGMVGDRFGEVGAVGGRYLPRLMSAKT